MSGAGGGDPKDERPGLARPDNRAAEGGETSPRPREPAPERLTRLEHVERQAGALAWLPGEPLRFVVVTSRRTRRWVFPKGGIEEGHSAPETAAREALEEAGVVGRSAPEPIGSFRSEKIRPPHVWTLEVDVFPVAIDEIRDDWLESAERDRRFVTLAEARGLLSDPDMLSVAERFAASRSR